MEAEERLGLDLKRAEQALMAAKTQALRPLGLTVAQYAALLGLSGSPGISAAALARQCLVTPQAMTSVLHALEQRGLITRSPHPWHQHVRQTELTESGRELTARADERAVAIERRLAAEFTESERGLLRRLLGRATNAIQRTEG